MHHKYSDVINARLPTHIIVKNYKIFTLQTDPTKDMLSTKLFNTFSKINIVNDIIYMVYKDGK